MPKLRVLSGKEVIAIFALFGFEVHSQEGSHVKLRRVQIGQSKESLTVPNHREIDRGTLVTIYRQALRFIPEQELRQHFFTV